MSTPDEPRHDTLKVSANASRILNATHVDVHLTVASSSAVRSARAAMALGEIAELVGELEGLGVAKDNVQIDSAVAQEGKGLFGRGSSARFSVRVERVSPDQLVGVLELATRLAHTTHEMSNWQFDLNDGVQEELIAEAAGRARARAGAAASAAGARLAGPLSMEVSVGEDDSMPIAAAGHGPMRAKAAISSVHSATGVDLVKRMEVAAGVRVTFRLLAEESGQQVRGPGE